MTEQEKSRVLAEFIGWHLPNDPELPVAWLDKYEHWVGFWAKVPTPKELKDGSYSLAGDTVWNPYKDANQALMIIKKMRSLRFWFTSENGCYTTKDKKDWLAEFVTADYLREGQAFGSTFQAAVCEAAIQAIK